MVVAPERYAAGERWIELAEGESLAVRIALIGAYACGQGALVLSALRHVAQTGLGIDPANPQGPRPSLTVERPLRVFEPDPPVASELNVTFRTPARLVHEGRVRRHLDAASLWRAMLRRADTLARCYGQGSIMSVEAPPPFEVVEASTRVVSVTRWSNRQRQRMTWPGVVGNLRMRGDGLREIAPLLGFIQRVQFGKGTSFGFGRVAFSSVDEKL
ncbi:MAG: CRISPR system precrRNA processing endoribonuclease RAMP protein Cas6 [Polyangiales bacterium]